MKKIIFFVSLFVLCFLLIGCGKNNGKDVLKDLTNKINDLKSYEISGQLEVINNDDRFNYDVSASYKENDKFKVILKNLANNHEQIILRNDDGVYVVTPSLNKSFKFQSDWPHNNSQVYLLKSIVDDLINDEEVTISEQNGNYILVSKVNFPNNSSLVKQRVTVDQNKDISKVEILDSNDIPIMTFVIESSNYKPLFNENYFEMNEIINNSTPQNEVQPSSTIDDIIYPLYIPTGTVLTDQEKIAKTNGERIILTFSGDKAFTLVEETVSKEEEFTIIPTYGEPYLLIDTVASLADNSINWVSNGIEYYIVSDVMSQNELIEVAKSVNVVSILK